MRGIETLMREGQVYAVGCDAACEHVDPDGPWPHDVKLQEDRGEIHTEDCGFFECHHDHDPGECCTAGRRGVRCRVGLEP